MKLIVGFLTIWVGILSFLLYRLIYKVHKEREITTGVLEGIITNIRGILDIMKGKNKKKD